MGIGELASGFLESDHGGTGGLCRSVDQAVHKAWHGGGKVGFAGVVGIRLRLGGEVRGFELAEIDEEAVDGVINEEDEFVAGDTFGVGGPVPPLELLGDGGLVAVADEFEFLVFVVEDFQEEHPAELFETLGIAGDATVPPHDVADVFDDGGDVGHERKNRTDRADLPDRPDDYFSGRVPLQFG